MTKFSIQNVVFLTSLMSLYTNVFMESVADPTEGFTNVPLTEYNFEIQRPYDIPLNQRYSYENGTRRLWVYADDKPHNPNSHTMPRTEIRIRVTFSHSSELTIVLHFNLFLYISAH